MEYSESLYFIEMRSREGILGIVGGGGGGWGVGGGGGGGDGGNHIM